MYQPHFSISHLFSEMLPQIINNINIEDRMLQTLAVVGEMVSYDFIHNCDTISYHFRTRSRALSLLF